VLELASVVVEHEGKCILNRVSLNLRRGEILGVVGRNGSGKSALLQLLSGGLSPKRGRVLLRGEEQTRDQSQLRQSSVFLRHGIRSHVALTMESWLDYTAFVAGADLDLLRPRLAEYREWLPSPSTRMDHLSWGQRRQAELAFALCQRSPIYCFDQATDGLDGLTQRQLGSQIKLRASEGTTFVLADHSAEFIATVCDRVLVMVEGGVEAYLQRDESGFRDRILEAQGWSV
jgi:ABC-type multidrug transport system ATPase subunit